MYQYISIYIYISVYIYISKYIYINIHIEKKNATFYVLLQKNETLSRSFTFFAKEQNVLFVLLCSLQKYVGLKNAKECIVLLGLISRQKLEKEHKRTLPSLNERKRMMRSERKRTWCPTLSSVAFTQQKGVKRGSI